jgi:hypothetical protein
MSTTEDPKAFEQSSADSLVSDRKPYRSPQLSRVGSVRELTLGGATTPNPDGGIGTLKPGM